ncbi:MAG: RNA-binding protein [Planctomycetota bacterium]|nr:MAG: RNA-binding protein [Planctomycetota bacterium]
MKKLYVGNLSYETTEDGLRTMFEEHGEVLSVAVITDRETGRSKGFAFIEMADDSAAQAAQEAIDGKEVEGRNLKVNEARPRENRGGGGGGRRGGGGGGRW